MYIVIWRDKHSQFREYYGPFDSLNEAADFVRKQKEHDETADRILGKPIEGTYEVRRLALP